MFKQARCEKTFIKFNKRLLSHIYVFKRLLEFALQNSLPMVVASGLRGPGATLRSSWSSGPGIRELVVQAERRDGWRRLSKTV